MITRYARVVVVSSISIISFQRERARTMFLPDEPGSVKTLASGKRTRRVTRYNQSPISNPVNQPPVERVFSPSESATMPTPRPT